MNTIWRGRGEACLPGLVLRELWATSRRIEGPLCAADGAWPGLEEGEGDRDGQAHKDCRHPPSPLDPHWSTATEKSLSCGAQVGGGGEVVNDTAGLQHQRPSRREKGENVLLMEHIPCPQL